jgi:Flp pilus assembly protein TadD
MTKRVRSMRILLVSVLLGLAACAGHGRPPLANSLSLRVADAAMASGAPAMALQVARDMLAKHPRDAGALVHEGDALAALERNDEAARVYERAVSLEPGNVPAHLGLGRVRLHADPAGAEALFRLVLAKDRLNAAALNDLGIALDLQGQHAAAQEMYTRALAAAPDMSAAQVNLGFSLALAGKSDRALGILRPIAVSASATPRIRQNFAVALVLAGRGEEARQILRTDLSEAQAADALAGYERLRQSPPTRVN